MAKITTTNDLLASVALFESSAAKHAGHAAEDRFIAAHLLCEAFESGRITNGDGKPFPAMTKWGKDDLLSAKACHLVARGLDSTTHKNAMKAFKGNFVRQDAMQRDYRNMTNAADLSFGVAYAMAYMAKATGVQAMVDASKGKVKLPAAWFLPVEHARRVDHDDFMGDASPWARLVGATSTRAVERIGYLTNEGAKAHAKAVAEWEAAGSKRNVKPQWHSNAAFVEASISPAGLLKVWREMVEAKAAASKPQQPTTDATVQQQQQTDGSPDGIPSVTDPAAPQQTDNRAPQQPSAPLPALVPALTALWRAASEDDHKVRFSPPVMAEWRNLADHVALNDSLRAVFLAAFQAANKDKDASKDDKAA